MQVKNHRGAFQVWGETWHNSIVLATGGEMERYGWGSGTTEKLDT
jgi:hypothetical protein